MERGLENTEITYLQGVGPKRAKVLEKEAGISTLRDLAYFFPARYADRTRYFRIAEITSDAAPVQIHGRFVKFYYEGDGKKRRLVGTFSDGYSLMQVVWFSGHNYISENFHPGIEYTLFGKPTLFRDSISMVHPEIERYDPQKPPEGLRGIYPMTEGMRKSMITNKTIHGLVLNLFNRREFLSIQDPIPADITRRLGLMGLVDALREIHTPRNAQSLKRARERLKFDELFLLQLHILRHSLKNTRQTPGYVLPKVGNAFNRFFSECLPFDLTDAQKRVVKEIRADMVSGHRMNRLLQGDVGSGKTVVALMTLLLAVDNGLQGALMAPTEILASQHYEGLKAWCDKIGVSIGLLIGKTTQKERRVLHRKLMDGSLDILVGTHALLEDKVEFKRLGVVVIDEQHRFGVAQRAKMWSKGAEAPPHILVMTATPIPRTLAMTIYGDLEVSVIDSLPPGRKPITTLLRYHENRYDIRALLLRELRAGRQAYFVFPLIKENEKLSLTSLEEGYKDVCEDFEGFNIGYIHGQMSSEEKEKQMQAFVEGRTNILVATTVIEVGVNVPNASVMVIKDAERFGLSQLHQLRGRVGRGADQSYCVLVTKKQLSATTRRRLEIMTQTTDGFLLSEEDLKLRGPGDIEGTMQSGLPMKFRLTDLARDGEWIALARKEASDFLTLNPVIPRPLDYELAMRFSNNIDWGQIS